ncbi:MAG TPA: hypothetical protein PLZ38_08300 [Spirochaetota bacterium]|nr:hypothetical protein [Spirochaetota bacterium]HOF14941.1 hypothetical protein [Spirochaetota bacterium]HOR93957.1 hypothetical protein [Spirochaetota bacterium]HOT19012.1 hypothetical protein [Spirochaetota bacterium]HPD04529.1 hypothetical protein [Spirochaetota bacterium]
MELHNPEATQQALAILRSGDPFQWYVITLLALVVYVYFTEIQNKNWQGIAAGLSLYMVHWFVEIINALIQHFSGHALWTVPTGTAFLLLIGVGVELSFMFSIAGLIFSKVLPKDPRAKILGINNRLFIAIANAAFFSIFEIFLVKTPCFVWVYPWWGALPVFITVYIPFWVVSLYCYDWQLKVQKMVIGSMFVVNAVMLVVFAGFLHWI